MNILKYLLLALLFCQSPLSFAAGSSAEKQITTEAVKAFVSSLQTVGAPLLTKRICETYKIPVGGPDQKSIMALVRSYRNEQSEEKLQELTSFINQYNKLSGASSSNPEIGTDRKDSASKQPKKSSTAATDEAGPADPQVEEAVNKIVEMKLPHNSDLLVNIVNESFPHLSEEDKARVFSRFRINHQKSRPSMSPSTEKDLVKEATERLKSLGIPLTRETLDEILLVNYSPLTPEQKEAVMANFGLGTTPKQVSTAPLPTAEATSADKIAVLIEEKRSRGYAAPRVAKELCEAYGLDPQQHKNISGWVRGNNSAQIAAYINDHVKTDGMAPSGKSARPKAAPLDDMSAAERAMLQAALKASQALAAPHRPTAGGLSYTKEGGNGALFMWRSSRDDGAAAAASSADVFLDMPIQQKLLKDAKSGVFPTGTYYVSANGDDPILCPHYNAAFPTVPVFHKYFPSALPGGTAFPLVLKFGKDAYEFLPPHVTQHFKIEKAEVDINFVVHNACHIFDNPGALKQFCFRPQTWFSPEGGAFNQSIAGKLILPHKRLDVMQSVGYSIHPQAGQMVSSPAAPILNRLFENTLLKKENIDRCNLDQTYVVWSDAQVGRRQAITCHMMVPHDVADVVKYDAERSTTVRDLFGTWHKWQRHPMKKVMDEELSGFLS